MVHIDGLKKLLPNYKQWGLYPENLWKYYQHSSWEACPQPVRHYNIYVSQVLNDLQAQDQEFSKHYFSLLCVLKLLSAPVQVEATPNIQGLCYCLLVYSTRKTIDCKIIFWNGVKGIIKTLPPF